uniref:Uncharacterized protein n=1 Tax=Anguilla anguilla TaxID=7936 RepID=A0A0E9V7Z8_ANGAN
MHCYSSEGEKAREMCIRVSQIGDQRRMLMSLPVS